MNPVCFVCESPATRVCKYQKCSSPPFYCSGPCIKGASEKMHRHDNGEDFVSYQQFNNKLLQIKGKLDPQTNHKECLERMIKKVNMIKDYLQEQINKIDKALEEFKSDLYNNLCLKLTDDDEEIIRKMQTSLNDESVTGKDVGRILQNQDVFIDQRKIKAAIQQTKADFDRQLQKILNFKVQIIFIDYQQRVSKSKVLHDEGVEFYGNKQYKQALWKFKEAREINDFDYFIHSQIGCCLDQLDQLVEAQQSYRRSLELNPNDSITLNNIGAIFYKTKRFEESIKWLSKSIEIDKTNSPFFYNRGNFLIKLKRYAEAMADFTTALILKPDSKQYAEKIKEIARIIGQTAN